MNQPPDEITIEGVTITPRSVRVGGDSFVTAHIESVSVVMVGFMWPTFLYGIFFFVLASFLAYNSNTVRTILGYILLAFGIFHLYQAQSKTIFSVAITTSGRKHALIGFSASMYKPDDVASARSKADAIASAIQSVL